MYGELLSIIFDFYKLLFLPDNNISSNLTFSIINGNFYRSLGMEGNFFSNFTSNIISNFANSYHVVSVGFVSYLLTYITFIFLVILLFKLFKWIFTLVFKLFRLN